MRMGQLCIYLCMYICVESYGAHGMRTGPLRIHTYMYIHMRIDRIYIHTYIYTYICIFNMHRYNIVSKSFNCHACLRLLNSMM